MNLAGQGAVRRPSGIQLLDDGGYIMVVLLIGMAVTAVWMGAMLPSWRQQAIREKEADLIFRGEQYARAIALFWRKNNQTLPPSLDVLVSQRYLRKKYTDPITNSDFLPVATASGVVLGGGGDLGAQPSLAGGRGQPPAQVPPSLGLLGRGAGISGVRSTSTATSIVVYRGQQSYSQFPFDYNVALQRMGVGRGGAGLPAGGQPPGRGRFTGAPGRGADEVAPIQPGRGRGQFDGRGTLGPPVQAPAPQ